MNPFIFHTPTKITFGEGIATTACEVVKELGGSRTLLVTDNALVKTKLVATLIERWQSEEHVKITVFSDVLPDANLLGVSKAVDLARNAQCNAMIALGGGSVMDTAKVVNIALTLGGNILDYQGFNCLPGPLLPAVAVPTTAGTGAEVSLVAMVKDDQEGKKFLFGSPFLAASQALLDPELIVTLPQRLTAATGMDAATHAIEAFVAEGTKSPLTDIFSLEALRMLFTYLPQAYKDGKDIEARSQTLVASTMAGMAFNSCGVGIIHALSHATGGQFSTHHGMTNAVFLPHGMQFNLTFATPRYAQMARYLNISNSNKDSIAAAALIEAVKKMISDLGLPQNLKSMSVPELTPERLTQLVALASCDPAMIFNTRQASEKDIIEMFRNAY